MKRSRHIAPTVASFAAYVCLAAACGGDTPHTTTDAGTDADTAIEVPAIALLSVEHASPVLPGTELSVITDGPLAWDGVQLTLSSGGIVATLDGDGQGTFGVTETTLNTIGLGSQTLTVDLVGAGDTVSANVVFEFAASIEASLTEVTDGASTVNGTIVLRGDGFLANSEGDCAARWQGSFIPDAGDPESVDVFAPIALAEPYVRTRATSYVPLAMSGLRTGDFSGTVTVMCRSITDVLSETDAIAVDLFVGPPAIYGLENDALWVGESLTFQGGGFLVEPGTSVLVDLDGMFVASDGSQVPVANMPLVVDVQNAETATFLIAAADVDKRLAAELFGHAAGRFEGTATPRVGDGANEIVGAPASIAFDVVGVRQVVTISYLPGFRESLARFGLAAAAAQIEVAIMERIDAIYAGYAVTVLAADVDAGDVNHHAVLEIGGPDPNGLGLFGFDNTAGKDVGNVRLFDRIGGANAETQNDGFPGFGGVFVESMLWWSEHPPGDLTEPNGRPPVDPLFDTIFDPVRLRAATPAETEGTGDPDRVAEVRRAIDALVSVVGETAAHELGHSLGLADPYGDVDTFHNAEDLPGCLMDRGGERPFGERAQQPGFEATRLCGDSPTYLEEILPTR